MITKDWTIDKILNSFPGKAQAIAHALTSAGLQCVGCHAATFESLEVGALGHGKTPAEVDALVRQINDIIAKETDPETIVITSRAAEKFLALLAAEGKTGYGMRFAEKMGGCNGFEYVLDYSPAPKEMDTVVTSNGVDMHIDKADMPRLIGSEIDYIDGLHGSGFKVSNPNAKSACGCGTSHSY